MRALYWRIYLTLVGVLLAFALGAGWLAERQLREERSAVESAHDERMQAVGELIGTALPPRDAPVERQADALQRWSEQLRAPLALESADGRRIATTPRFGRREERGHESQRIALADGRVLLAMRPMRPPPRGEPPVGRPDAPRLPVLLSVFVVLFVGVALGAWPVVRRLTRRLEALKQGVERFGAGELQHRVVVDGRDEVADLARSFNATADRIAALLQSNQNLLANASHELRSPLARLKMALALRGEGAPSERLDAEIARNLQELDALVDEVLLASRLEAGGQPLQRLPVDAVALAAELAAQHGVALGDVEDAPLQADERLLRRALRNLLENARRYGNDDQSLTVRRAGPAVEFRVVDRGPGVPPDLRERIFEPFFRLPGHAEVAGGVGLGLALVRHIAQAHGGKAWVEPRSGGGSVFVISLPTGG